MKKKNELNKAHKSLRLQAQTPQDITVLSALLQDALIHIGGMHYNPKEGLFTLLANRFCWETGAHEIDGLAVHKRTRSGLHFSHVTSVRHKGIARTQLRRIHNLLAIRCLRDNEIRLLFSHNAQISLSVNKILCHLTDLQDHWWTTQKPIHEL
jgi:hypothetical protein